MGKDNIIVEYTDTKENGFESAKSKFKKIASEYFEFNIIVNKNIKTQINEISRFANLNLPPESNEIFINYNQAQLFWAIQTPLSTYIEKFLEKSLTNFSSLDDHREIKENYSKWVTAQSLEEKKRLAVLTLKLIEQSISKFDFYNRILHGVILLFEDSLFNPERAQELFTEAEDIISKLQITNEVKSEMHYLLNLYKGFISLRLKKYEDAKLIFNNCLTLKPAGVTAIFYLAYSEVMLGNFIDAGSLLKNIWQYDLSRISFAIEQNNLLMFNQVMDNLVLPNVFHFDGFSNLSDDINNIVEGFKYINMFEIESLKKKVASWLLLKFNIPNIEPYKKSISFINKVLASFNGRKNIYFQANVQNLENKFEYTLQLIIDSIHARYEKEIQDNLKGFEQEVNEKLTEIENTEAYLEELKTEIKNWQTKHTSAVEKKYSSEISELENKVNTINNVVELNPLNSFSNTMTYNLILSFIVFVVGIFATYLNNSGYGGEFDNNLSQVLSGGLKWGLICYVIGSVIAAIIAGTVGMERANVRQRFLARIKSLRYYKDQELENIRIKAKREEEDAIDNFKKKKIAQLKKTIENIRSLKSQKEVLLRKEAEEKIKKETEIFQPFLKLEKQKSE